MANVDDPDLECTGVRHCVRIDLPPSPRPRKRVVTISLLDSDTDDDPPSSRFPRHPTSPSRSRSRSRPQLNPLDQRTELQRVTQSDLESRTALLDTRPAKKRATEALKMAANAVDMLESKRKIPEVIEISSDSEPEMPPLKKYKLERHTEPPHEAAARSSHSVGIPKQEAESSSTVPSSHGEYSDDDDDCLNFLASLDISNEANWVSLPERNKAEDLTPADDSDNDINKPHLLPPLRVPRTKPPINSSHVPLDWPAVGLWGLANSRGIAKYPKSFYPARRQDRIFPRRPPNLYYEKGYSKLGLTAKYPHLASGSVNKIIQAHGNVVLCASVVQGLEDSDDEDAEDRPPPPENELGSLVVYHHGRSMVLRYSTLDLAELVNQYMWPRHIVAHVTHLVVSTVTKYYTVNDIVFNPHNPRQFLSSGHDLVVQAWEILDDNEESDGLVAMRQISFDCRPHDLVYNVDGSVLAVTCYDGTVRLYYQDLFEDMIDAHYQPKKLHAAPSRSGHATGTILWGVEPVDHLLFTSSEPVDKDNYSGFHHAFDARRGVQAVQFDATEAGDAAALSPNGTTLVLITQDKDTHPIRLYDVRRKAKEAYETEELEKFSKPEKPKPGAPQESVEEEVNQASFSPDGRLLAVARTDNALHVYDVRALSRGPLCQFEHHESDSGGGRGYGVVAFNWMQGRSRIGILSGGNDGCVRLWEPALGEDETQGTVLGRTDFDVAHFSVGERQKEFPLVIGDAGGGMHTCDFTNPCGTLI